MNGPIDPVETIAEFHSLLRNPKLLAGIITFSGIALVGLTNHPNY